MKYIPNKKKVKPNASNEQKSDGKTTKSTNKLQTNSNRLSEPSIDINKPYKRRTFRRKTMTLIAAGRFKRSIFSKSNATGDSTRLVKTCDLYNNNS